MRYPLYDLHCDDFENLVILICNHILGSSTIPFAKGKDGGKDGKFIGKANKIPSDSEPWKGKFIIQAKHTTTINATCSDSLFKRIIDQEVITAINALKRDDEIEFYLLFTNRSLSGIQDSVISKKIKEATGIPTILFADEKIQMYLKEYPDIVRTAGLNRLLLPFAFDESDLREVIVFLHQQIKENRIEVIQSGFEYPGLDKKNELNNLSKCYFDGVVKQSMEDFKKIRSFLSDPINQEIEGVYADLASELNAKITLYRNQFYEFEQILEACYDKIITQDSEQKLQGKKRLVRTLLHYMYCNCDIGIKDDCAQ